MKLDFFKGLALVFLLTSCTVSRTVFWNFADQRDIKRFESNPIPASGSPFTFHEANKLRELRIDDRTKTGWLSKPLDLLLEQQKAHKAFVVIKDDSIVYEHYAEEVDRETQLTVYSVSKSILSTLVGIAIEEGFIGDLDDPITRYIPELQEREGFEQINLRHLLTHTSGIRSREDYVNPFSNDAVRLYYSKSFHKVMKRLRVERNPEQEYEYASINSQLLGLILIRTTGVSISDYLSSHIWQEIGGKEGATWSVYEKDRIEKAFCCLNATILDFAKFGKLIMNEGEWEGKQLVPAEWIRESVSRSTANGSIWRYQYHWRVGLKEYGDFMAQGLYAQYIYVMPKKNIIIVSIQDFHRPNKNWPGIFRQIVDQL